MVFSGDGSYLVMGDFLGNLKYIDATDWSLLPPFGAHSGTLTDLDAYPGGTLLASAGEDGVRVLNVADQSLHTEIDFNGETIRVVKFIDDSHLLVVPKVSESAIVISLDPDDLVDIGKARVTRAFTETECLTYDIDPCLTTLDELRGD
jgi:WD40 repeat protein